MKLPLQLLISFTTLLLMSCQSASSGKLAQLRETPFPSLEEVYTHVNKQLVAPGKNCQFSLAKKADGYYLMITPYKKNKPQEPVFLKAWDVETKKHLPLNIDKYLDKESYSSGKYTEGLAIIKTQGVHYDSNYLFGYPDYTRDLIELLEDKEDLKSNELEMLARAYSAQACDYIHPNQSGSNISASKDLPELLYSKIPASRLSSFLKFSEQSIACYRKIEQTDPKYKPLVFHDVNLKINHDIMNYYLLLKSVKEDQAADRMLKLVNYHADAIAYAKELLIDCAENGILITAGDTDTFPLWYVQEALGFRKDVKVVNHSLLHAAWYIDFVRNTMSLKSSFSKEEYQFYSKAYIMLQEIPGESAPSYPEWLAQVRAKGIPTIKDPNYVLSWEEAPVASKNLTLEIQGVSKNITLENYYLSNADLSVLDLIHSNKNSIFYATSPTLFFGSGLASLIAKRNLVYELTGSENNSYSDEKSLAYLKKAIRANRINYNTSRKDISNYVIYSRLADWMLLDSNLVDANRASFESFVKQLGVQERIKEDDCDFADMYTSTLWNMDRKKAETFRDQYAKKAIELLHTIDNQAICSREDYEKIETIYRMYRTRMDNQQGSPAQNKVIAELKQKIKTLCANPNNIENLSWTLESLQKLNTELARY